MLYNGTFWVSVFFVLSGFVLARASARRREHFARDVAIRYLRLALPAAASVVLAWTLLRAFPTAARTLNELAPSPWLRWVYQDPIPSIRHALQEGLLGIFLNGSSDFDNVLWTMRIELVGSLGVYAFFHWCRSQRLALGLLAVATLCGVGARSGWVAFAVGAVLQLLVERGLRIGPRVALLASALGLLIGSEARGFAVRHGLGAWPTALQPGHPEGLAYPLGALLVVVGVLFSPAWRTLMTTGPCQWLGRISFALYLVHVPLLYTVCAAAAVHFGLRSTGGLLVLAATFLPLAMLAALLFERVIDGPVLQLNRHLARTVR